MARTKASVGAKVSSGKSSKARCSAAPPPSSNGSSGSSERAGRSSGGGNPMCPRETPKWQRPITNFFNSQDPSPGSDDQVNDVASGSTAKPKPKRNIIHSDDEASPEKTVKSPEKTVKSPEKTVKSPEKTEAEKPKNTALDETLELEPLTGEDSHKIEEYYPKNGAKDKGKGKKTNKENIDRNNERKSVKRDLDSDGSYELSAQANKKIKVN